MRRRVRVGGWILKVVVGGAMVVANYRAIPSANTTLTRCDTLIVLGTPCTAEGEPSSEQRERVLEGVREFRAGVARHMIVTGGAAHNDFVEADCMKRLAIEQGVPAAAVVEEKQGHDKIQNLWVSKLFVDTCVWLSAEVVCSLSHLPEAVLQVGPYKGMHGFAERAHA